jgi:hypothetical protein
VRGLEQRVADLEQRAGAFEDRLVFVTVVHGAGDPIGYRVMSDSGPFQWRRAIYDPDELEPGDIVVGEGDGETRATN